MSVAKKHASEQVFYGREALRLLREQQATNSHATPDRPEPTPSTEAVADIPIVLPSGVGFAVAMPLRTEVNRVAAPGRPEDALTIIPRSLPTTVMQQVGAKLVFSYVVQDVVPQEVYGQEELDVIWRIRLAIRLKAAARGWVVPEQTTQFENVPADSGTVIMAGSFGRVYTLLELRALLDQAAIPTREQYERELAKWRTRFAGPELILEADDVVVEAAAALDDRLLHRLLDDDKIFRETWLRQRTDLPDRVQAYERELTRVLAAHKFEAQQIVNALIQWRRSHGMKPELRTRHFRQLLSQEWRGTAEPSKGTLRQRTPRRDRRQLCVAANDAEQTVFEAWARREGQTISNLIRLKFGMPPTHPGRPDPIQKARREDWIYEELQRLGIDPTPYFPEG